MSSQTRTTGGSRQSKKINNVSGSAKTVTVKKTEHPKTEKEKVPVKPTAEQIRIAQITDINSGSEDPKMREKVVSIMETTHRTEEDVCYALYQCDNDLDRAVIYLFEFLPVGAFKTSSKKKKNRLTSGSGDATGDEWADNGTSGPNNNDVRERSRNRTGMRGGRGGTDSRGWRGRESRENDRNASDTRDTGERGARWQGGSRGGGRGGFRGGFGGRGGRGGRMGPRGTTRDNNRSNFFMPEETHRVVETWDNNIVATSVEQNKPDEVWGDWDNEEYTGSLADTKVFTPSTIQNQTVELSAPPGLEQQLLNPPSQLTDDLVQYSATVVSSTATAGAVASVNNNQVQYPEIHGSSVALRQALDMPQLNASLSVEQSQYFNSLSSQNSNQQASINAYQVPQSVQYPTSYASNNSFADQVVSQQAPTRKLRARVPPPSKIPSTAVEMPGDTLNNIGYLDVQFGGLELGNEESFDTITDKFNATIDNSQNVASDVTTDYKTKSSVQQQQNVLASQMIPSGDVLSSQNDGLSTAYNQRGSSVQQSTSVGSAIGNSAALEQLTKADHYGNAVNASGYHNQSAYNNNVSSSKNSGYQAGTNQQGYSNSNYSQQVTTGNSYSTAASNSYSSYNQSGVNSYQQSNANNVSGVNSSTGVSSNNAVPVGSGSVNNSNSNSNSGYLSSQYPSSQTSSAYPSQPSNVYQSNQSVYGNAGLSNNTGYANSSNVSSAASQYSNFSSTKLKETTPVTTIYESAVSSAPSAVANSAITTSSMSSPSLGLTNTKVTSSTAKSSGIVPSNVAMVSQYIPTGMPFYQHQQVYSYEDIQMMQQRMPPVPGYYDMNYQTPTSLGAAGVRDANIGSVAAYSTISDGRFTRTDNNSSPVSNVPSTMSQQTGSGGAPMLNLPYAYFYGGNMMPGGFQYGTPAIYPQQMPTANASSGAQFPKPSYNSGYGSTAYDTLSQTTQDYSKGAYPGTGVGQQSKGQVTNPPPTGTGSDISSSMYGKSHVALNKVNSYDKQSFHSGTPPPASFNMTGTQTAAANSQAYGAQHLYIQAMPAGHHNMNMHQPIHPMDGRVQNASRRDSNSTGQRQQSSSQSKSGAKPGYSPSYWAAQN